MGTNEDYNVLVRERSRLSEEYRACERRIGECDELLKRLRPVKKQLVEIKSDFSSVVDGDQKISEETGSWRGTTFQKFRRQMSDVNAENRYYFNGSLDYALDALNDRITEIENKKAKEFGLLGRLAAAINSLANRIENYFN